MLFYNLKILYFIPIILVLSFIMILLFFLFYFKRIVFDSSSINIERIILPKIIINYDEISDFCSTSITTTKKRVALIEIENSNILLEHLFKLIEDKKIPNEQYKGELIYKEIIARRALFWGLIISIPLTGIFFLFQFLYRILPFFNRIDLRAIGLVYFAIQLIVSLFTYFFIIKRSKRTQITTPNKS